MKYLSGIRAEVNSLYRSKVNTWLAQHVKTGKIDGFPKRIYLGAPTRDEEVLQNKEAFLSFCNNWKQELSSGKVDFLKKTYSGIGEIEVPVHLVFDKPEELAKWAGHLVEFHSAIERLDIVRMELPNLVDSALDRIHSLTGFDDVDFMRFIKVCKWLCENPRSGRLIRQIPVRGISNAWFERYRAVLLDFLRPYMELDPLRRDLLQIGLVPPAALVRIILLDRALRAKAGGMRYFAASTAELSNLDMRPDRVLFCEDVATAISLPDLDGTAVIVLASNIIAQVCGINWVANARCQFLGSIDLRAFSMLNNVRVHLPRTESVLMDIDTLLNNKDLWTNDDISPQDLEMPTALSSEEFNVYRALASDSFGRRVRLELERLPLELIFDAIGAGGPVWNKPPVLPRLRQEIAPETVQATAQSPAQSPDQVTVVSDENLIKQDDMPN